MTLSTGSKLGPYEIVAPIGAGGMGEVYKARDTRLGRTVAIKVLNKAHMERFEREARAIAALNHPNICQLYDIGPDYLVMEYIEGSPIKGPLQAEEAVRLAIQIANALEEAHKNRILHRDLKVGNILVTGNGTVKLLDFGLAKIAEGSAAETASTIEGTVMGTPAYMSPEQAQGKLVDARSDIFSFGAVLYELISGKRAFEGAATIDILSAVLRDEPKSLLTLPQLEKIVTRCLAKQPVQRYQTIAEVRAALEALSAKPTEQQPSIAVLPFANMSGDKEQEYFSDGLAEEIINALTQIPKLKVIARTSAFAFRGKEQDITKIAEALRVRTILEGSVRKAGNRIRVTAQLIDADDGSHLWSQRYDRELTDIFAIQDEIAQAIAGKLRMRLPEDRPLVKRQTKNVEAYNLYLNGYYHLQRLTSDGLSKSKDYFDQAITLSPNYALAWYGLAQYHYMLGFLEYVPPKAANTQSKQAAIKALELDEMLPQAHSMIAVLRTVDFEWEAAKREFDRALELDPDSEEVWSDYSFYYLLPMRRWNEAIAATRHALKRDPLSAFLQWRLGLWYYFACDWDRSIEQFRIALELDPRYFAAHLFMGESYRQKGDREEALRESELVVELAGDSTLALACRGATCAFAGRKDDARRVLAQMQEIARKRYVSPGSFAWLYLALGETDQCLDWLEKAVDERDSRNIHFRIHPVYAPLSSHTRFQALIRKMNLEA